MRIWAYVAIVAAVIGILTWAHAEVYTSGYNAAVLEYKDRVLQARAAERDFWKRRVEEAEGTIITEEKIVEKIVEIERRIPVVVSKIVEVAPQCEFLPDVSRVFNEQLAVSVTGAGTDTVLPES